LATLRSIGFNPDSEEGQKLLLQVIRQVLDLDMLKLRAATIVAHYKDKNIMESRVVELPFFQKKLNDLIDEELAARDHLRELLNKIGIDEHSPSPFGEGYSEFITAPRPIEKMVEDLLRVLNDDRASKA
jgi:hypothetical protein